MPVRLSIFVNDLLSIFLDRFFLPRIARGTRNL